MSSLGFQAEGCRLMAQSGHSDPRNECLLWRVKRTRRGQRGASKNTCNGVMGAGAGRRITAR
jgi:hypothetical protein